MTERATDNGAYVQECPECRMIRTNYEGRICNTPIQFTCNGHLQANLERFQKILNACPPGYEQHEFYRQCKEILDNIKLEMVGRGLIAIKN